ncbi:hypothetical protein GCM10009069_05540 [Algimonas arctica]|uniref:Transposase IS66 C-terminal domain-containing protein n=1 Tax=Algimonas arctica TaxID=1479486 RepID=A0A8J3G151_9PROT|nr:hypothetical protein GCM10009069_05540 [Algimonas arctica]
MPSYAVARYWEEELSVFGALDRRQECGHLLLADQSLQTQQYQTRNIGQLVQIHPRRRLRKLNVFNPHAYLADTFNRTANGNPQSRNADLPPWN